MQHLNSNTGTTTFEMNFTTADGGGTIKVISNDKQVGYANIHVANGHIKIHKLKIYKEHRNQNFGTDLMCFILKWCKKNDVFSANVHACSGITEEMMKRNEGLTQEKLVSFYEKYGFIKCHNDWLTLNFNPCCKNISRNVWGRC